MRTLQVAALAFLIMTLAGCGSHPSISGKVTYKGKDLNMGTVHLLGPDGKTKTIGGIAPDGTYKIIEPPVGLCKVGVEVRPPQKLVITMPKDKTKSPEKSGYIEPVMIPATYSDPLKSGLTVEVTGGAFKHDIELK